jgi:hypothetical protein
MEKTSISIKRGRRGLPLAAVALSALHPGAAHATGPLPYFDAFSLDWTVTYQSAPYVPMSSSAVPELSTWAMLTLGFRRARLRRLGA